MTTATNTAPTTSTYTFADYWHTYLLGAGLTDRTAEVGLHGRCAFAGTPAQWDAVHAAMGTLRGTQSGSARGATTRAMGRITTTAMRDDWRASRAARKAARLAE